MTDRVDLVIAEIKRLRKEVKDNIAELGNSESERIGLFKDLEIYDNILSFIDSKEDSPCIKCEGDGLPGTCASISELGRCPLKNQKQEQVCNDLEDEITRYCEPIVNMLCNALNNNQKYSLDFGDIARHFAEWQKEKMINGAVDGKIYETQARSKVKATTTGYVSNLDYKVGEKVKLLIIKEE